MGTVEIRELVAAKLRRLTEHNRHHPVALALVDADHLNQLSRTTVLESRELLGTVGLVKDDIAVSGLPLTCGSKALAEWQPTSDAHAVRALQSAGAVIAGKGSMSEWAGGRSDLQVRGWSGIGGQLGHPRDPRCSPGGSSSGSAVAVATGVVDWALGSELVGSVVGPASINGVFGLKPTHGAISADGLAPANGLPSQGTIGILANDPQLLGRVFSVMSGGSQLAGPHLDRVPQRATVITTGPRGCEEQWAECLDRLLSRLSSSGAKIATTDLSLPDESFAIMQRLLTRESALHYDRFFRSLPKDRPCNLQELVDFNDRNRTGKLGYDDQRWFEAALDAEPLTAANFPDHAKDRRRLTASVGDAIENVMRSSGADFIFALTERPSWAWDADTGDPEPSAVPALACVSGYPHISIPGLVTDSWSVGVSIIGRPHTDWQLISLATTVHQLFTRGDSQ